MIDEGKSGGVGLGRGEVRERQRQSFAKHQVERTGGTGVPNTMGEGEEPQTTCAVVSSADCAVDGPNEAAANCDERYGGRKGNLAKQVDFGGTLAIAAPVYPMYKDPSLAAAATTTAHSDSSIAPWPTGSLTNDPPRDPNCPINPTVNPLSATCHSPSLPSTHPVPDSKPPPLETCCPGAVLVQRVCCPFMIPCGPAVPTQVHVVQWTSGYGRDAWAGGLWDCCQPAGDGASGPCLCCLTCWCPCAIFGRTVEKAGWGSCGPSAIIYFLSTCGTSILLLVVVICMTSGLLRMILPLASLLLLLLAMGLFGGYYRTALRKKLGFDGNDYLDRLVHAFCFWCALCQEYRTLSPPAPKRPRRLAVGANWAAGVGGGVPIVLPPSCDITMV